MPVYAETHWMETKSVTETSIGNDVYRHDLWQIDLRNKESEFTMAEDNEEKIWWVMSYMTDY